ncbi:MAG: hypothetical protein WCK58_10275 [Chloroflexota bacterium]
MTDAQLGDLVIFVTILLVVIVAGGALGMIVARRVDGLLAPRPVSPPDAPATTPEEDQHP